MEGDLAGMAKLKEFILQDGAQDTPTNFRPRNG